MVHDEVMTHRMRPVPPDKTRLRRYLRQGLTQAQIADAWYLESGERVGRSTIGMAILRYELQDENPHARPRYEDLLPWKVFDEHKMLYDARMLRLEGRLRAGLELTKRDERMLRNWKVALEKENAVVHYDGDTEEGFFWVDKNDPAVIPDGLIDRSNVES